MLRGFVLQTPLPRDRVAALVDDLPAESAEVVEERFFDEEVFGHGAGIRDQEPASLLLFWLQGLHILRASQAGQPRHAIKATIEAGDFLDTEFTTRQGNQRIMEIQDATMLAHQGHYLEV